MSVNRLMDKQVVVHIYNGMLLLLPAAKLLQSCPTLCDPMDCSLPGFSVHGILQARTLEWVAISFSNAWKWKVKVKSLSRVWLLATPWTAAHQAPPSMGFSGQQYLSGVPLPSPQWNVTQPEKKEHMWVSSKEVDEPIESEASQKDKNKYHVLTHIYGI